MKKERFTIFLPSALSEKLKEAADGDLLEVPEFLRSVVRDHLLGKCGPTTASQNTTAKLNPSDEPKRRPGRPVGGSVENEGVRRVIMDGSPEEIEKVLIECGFFPPGCSEVISGDPKNPPSHFDMAKPKARDRLHEIVWSERQPGEVEYWQKTRLFEREEGLPIGHIASRRSVTLDRQELWTMVRKAIKN